MRILDEELGLSVKELKKKFKNFDRYPPAIQKALLDMQYNMGDARFSREKWPKFYESIDKLDWMGAAKESHRRGLSEERNNEIYNLFFSTPSGYY